MINDLTDSELRQEFIELCDVLTTLELCYEFNKNHKPNTAIRECAKRLKKRMTVPRINLYLDACIKDFAPSAWINKQKRKIGEKCKAWDMSYEDYILMGARLNG